MHETFLLTFAIIATGVVLRSFKVVEQGALTHLSRLVINVILPALILRTIPNVRLTPEFAVLPLVNILFGLLSGFVASRMFRSSSRLIKGPALLSSVGFNIGLFGYALIEGLYGQPGLERIALFDFGNAFLVFGLGYWFAWRNAEEGRSGNPGFWGIIKLFAGSLPFVSYIVAILINLCGLSLPAPVNAFLDVFAGANRAMALLVLGLSLQFDLDWSQIRTVAAVLAMRYLLGLAVGLAIWFFTPLDAMMRIVLLCGLLLPVPLSIIPFSVEFRYGTAITGAVSNLAIVISFVLLWLLTALIGPLPL